MEPRNGFAPMRDVQRGRYTLWALNTTRVLGTPKASICAWCGDLAYDKDTCNCATCDTLPTYRLSF